jgi:hypothetical protein
MTLLTSTSGGTHGLLPEQLGTLIVQPVREKSVALRVATVVTTTSNEYDPATRTHVGGRVQFEERYEGGAELRDVFGEAA